MNQWKGRARVFSLMLFVLFLWAGLLQPGLSLGQKAKADEEAVAPAPNLETPEKLYKRALAAIAKKDYSTALEDVKMLTSMAYDLPGKKNKAASYAIESCNKIIQAEPDNLIQAAAYYFLSVTYWSIGQQNKAIEAAKEAVRLAPDNRVFHSHLGWLYAQTNNYGQAIHYLQKALSFPRPGLKLSDKDRHIDDLDDALRIYGVLGCSYYQLGQFEQAIKAFEKSVELNPDHSATYHLLAGAYYGNKNYESAKVALLKAIRLADQAPPSYYFALGQVYSELGKRDEAEEAYKKALELDKDYAEALLNLGVLYYNRGSEVLAADYYYRAGILMLRQNNRDGALLALDKLSRTGSALYEKLYSEVYPDMPLKEKREKK